MGIRIKDRFSGVIMREIDADSLRGANLRDADLTDANLRGADLTDANLRGADLRRADLFRANLTDADLTDANLRGADLRRADLFRANLRGADLTDANLTGANLTGADLFRANLTGALGIKDRIIDGAARSDGYRFLLTRTEPGPWRVKAGCRNFTLPEARAHWAQHRPVGNLLGDETRLILDHMEAVATRRGWPETGEER